MANSYDQFRVGLATTNLGDIRPERVSWIWPGRLAVGKLTALDGLPDLGKSTIALDLSARITTGRAMPDGPNGLDGPGDVVLFSAEDGLADTVAPRMEAAGGDRTRVHVVTATHYIGEEGDIQTRWPDLKRDVELLRATVEDAGARLVVIDVLMAYLDARTNSYRDQDMRSVLGPLAAMAEQTGCAVLFLRHPTKNGARDPILAGGGSIGIIGAARVGLLASFHPEDEELPESARRRLLAVSKCNVAAKADTLVYRLIPPDGHDVAAVIWGGTSPLGARDLTVDPRDASEHAELTDAQRVVMSLFADGAGAVRASDAEEAGRRAGIPKRTLTEARRKLHITTEKASMDSGWWWVLPSEGANEEAEEART
jgi:hypothetical protein